MSSFVGAALAPVDIGIAFPPMTPGNWAAKGLAMPVFPARLNRLFLLLFVAASLALSGCRFGAGEESAQPASAPLISRNLLLGDPARSGVRISPDGRNLAYLAPRNGVLNLWVAPVSSLGEARAVTGYARGRIGWHGWSPDGRSLVYTLDNDGDENWVVYAADVANGANRALTPTSGVSARVLSLTSRDPLAVLIAMNSRDPSWRDVYSINIRSGEPALVYRNERGFGAFWADQNNRLRLATRQVRGGELELWAQDAMGGWKRLLTLPPEDARLFAPIGFDAEGKALFLLDSVGRDRAALVRLDTQSGEKSVLGEHQGADVTDVWISPVTHQPQAFAGQYLKRNWQPLTPEAKADLEFLEGRLVGEPVIVSRSRDDQRWIVEEDGPQTPPRVLLYDRGANTLRTLFAERPGLLDSMLLPMIPTEITARDGLTLVAYLTLPAGSDGDGDGRPDAPLPLVMLVHPGPWARDGYGFSAQHQWLANRGYAVLSVNFRGSTGFGKSFVNAGNRQWGAKIQEDLQDGAQWAKAQSIADPARLAIVGQAFGGYSALAAMALHPASFACAVALGGPSNLEAYLAGLPAYWKPDLEDLYVAIGDPRLPVGLALLRAQSPARHGDRVKGAVLLAQGGQDARVRPAQSAQMAQALETNGAGITYLSFPEEGGELALPQNRLAFYAAAEAFLGRCLGGRIEPFGAAERGANLRVPIGAARIAGLAAALPAGADR